MKLLLDQDVYEATARLLDKLGHDVVRAAQLGLAQADDTDLLKVAHETGRVFVTRDRDFGSLVFVQNQGTGVVYLRLSPSNQDAVHEELARVLQSYSESELRRGFIVVEPGRHRFRRLPSQ